VIIALTDSAVLSYVKPVDCMLFYHHTQAGEKPELEMVKLAPIVAEKEIDQIVNLTCSTEQLFAPADRCMEITGLTER
jgi:hypothetical protein